MLEFKILNYIGLSSTELGIWKLQFIDQILFTILIDMSRKNNTNFNSSRSFVSFTFPIFHPIKHIPKTTSHMSNTDSQYLHTCNGNGTQNHSKGRNKQKKKKILTRTEKGFKHIFTPFYPFPSAGSSNSTSILQWTIFPFIIVVIVISSRWEKTEWKTTEFDIVERCMKDAYGEKLLFFAHFPALGIFFPPFCSVLHSMHFFHSFLLRHTLSDCDTFSICECGCVVQVVFLPLERPKGFSTRGFFVLPSRTISFGLLSPPCPEECASLGGNKTKSFPFREDNLGMFGLHLILFEQRWNGTVVFSDHWSSD